MATFRTRARAVDMLGRQQIAGIPTAISELFKNAHDAYAEQAVVDFFRSDRLFVLRDDGVGMTKDDFEQRWLTLGTESKAGLGGTLAPPARRPGSPTRPVLGEKGIGRLAIAAIGPQVLMLSRPLRDGNLGDVLAAFVNWGLFELPSANLEDIQIPVVTVRGGSLPTLSDIRALVDSVESNLASLATRADLKLTERIRSELKDFRDFDPNDLSGTLGEPQLLDGPGTHFFIRPASGLLTSELDESSEQQATPLRKMLVGFANTMTPQHKRPALATSFRDHYTEDAWADVISEADFFLPEEFEAADHHISGHFDAHGQFTGTVSVYGGEPEAYTVAWPRVRGTLTRCGPFDFNLAYVQGTQRDSRLDPALWNSLNIKLNRFGGLYIYRDGIRVLPYGNTDFDFLDIEVRRAKSASDNFFSYRRMFGVIELTRAENGDLREKAGREGFADNEAYRQFREILMNFLYQVAVDYFRESGSLSERYWAQRQELERLDKARQRRSRQTRVRRKAFTEGLDAFFERVELGQPQSDAVSVLARFGSRLEISTQLSSPGAVAEALVQAEADARAELRQLSQAYDVTKPRGIGLTRSLTRTWAAYENEKARLAEEVFVPAQAELQKMVTAATRTHHIEVDRRLRFDSAVESATRTGRELVRSSRRELESASKDARTRATELAREVTASIDRLSQDVLAEAARLDVSSLSERNFVNTRSQLEERLLGEANLRVGALASIVEQISAISWPDGDGPAGLSHFDEVEALETDLEELRERAERDLELVQLGTAIEVINHEFEGTVTSIRRNLRRFKEWSDANPALREPYRDLRASFEHLDGYLRLFTPLHRRLYRTQVEIVGSEIEKFVRDVFERRLEIAQAELRATAKFSAHRFMQYPSVIFPVFVNLVDNALYWLTDYRGDRVITLDLRGAALIVRDSGPGISGRDREAVFEFGFSRKPGGSGYGLYISREILRREGWDIELAPASGSAGAEFRILEVKKRGKR